MADAEFKVYAFNLHTHKCHTNVILHCIKMIIYTNILGWVFGMVERGTTNVILVPVDRRDRQTLLPIIQDNIEDFTTVMSDGWAAYVTMGQLPQNYQHYAVNHRVNPCITNCMQLSPT